MNAKEGDLMRLWMLVSLVAFATPMLRADPLLVRGADGSYLPILAEQWQAKGSGVYVKVKSGVDPAALKEKLAEKFPEQTIEIRNGQLFFASVEVDVLLHLLTGVETGVSLPQDPVVLLREKKDVADNLALPPDQRPEPVPGELVETEVVAVSFSGVDGLIKAEVLVRTPPASGEFAKLKGPVKVKAFFKMKRKKVDADDEDNQRKSDILLVQPKSLIYLRLEKKETDETYLVSEARLKKY